MKVTYSVGESRHRRNIDVMSLDPTEEFDMLEICEQCAKDHHSNYDGWEGSWPITVRIYLDGEEDPACTAEVALEYEPEFNATLKAESGD